MALLDTVLDRSVIGGYSRLGYAIRSRTWNRLTPGSMVERTVAVTGATSGIGAAAAARIAALGGSPILVGRDSDRAERVRASILQAQPGAVVGIELGDVSDLSEVRELANRLTDRGVDGIVHNAGVMPPERTESADGHEMSLATHVLGPVLLTELLAPHLAAARDPRVVFMSSGGMYTASLPSDDLEYQSGAYRGARAYARSKRVQVALLPILADRWAAAGVTVSGMHPGWVDTPGVTESLPGFRRVVRPLLRSAEEGADTAVWLLSMEPTPPSGLFWHDRAPRPTHYFGGSDDGLARVWREIADACRIPETKAAQP
ncbi:SDR family NAD(P)-dependent oxidoreductase [Gordonia sp. PDNC005]|uniref:SDR family NAD(P)-dependent oxidoreductase n=1 Tax=unclassified Gordonia (in: high G+C Gram-positive bacteria) TaxID=2657482 RepID=UPI00196624A9|nr:SDR family NAD(P)-dependent oxidoreductase [Gordonia sp. PDNC005]QRY62007.1 SDR family NAD(P)-dependent oxidoreductase [Gordonia sp. PDNC005]